MPEVGASALGGALTRRAAVKEVLSQSGLGDISLSEATRLIEQGGVRLNGEVLVDPAAEYSPRDGDVWKIGKRNYVRVKAG